MPTVDIVHDVVNDGIPFPGQHLDYLLCRYIFEHVPHAKVMDFLLECYRVLKPGGTVIFFGPDLQAQGLEASWKAYNADYSVTVFGAQEPGVPPHQNGFSKRMLRQRLRMLGFVDVDVVSHPMAPTDLIATARRPAEPL